MIMENSSASAFSDEIPNNMNMGSCMIDFSFSPALPSSCSVYDIPPPPSPLSDYRYLNDASFAGYMDSLSSHDFNDSWFSYYNFETGTSESLPPAIQTNLQLPPLPVLSPAATSEALNSQATAVSDSSSNTSSLNGAGAAVNKPVVAVAWNEDALEIVEGKQAEAEVRDRGGDHRIEVVENRNDQNQTKKPVKPKKWYKKKQRPTRHTIKTETEVDHLDDGFRWRKYGEKPVKNSPFPRSYYRCTTPGCGAKKRLERSAPEPSMLLTSYEGDHTHLSPKVTHSARLEIINDAIAAGAKKIRRKKILKNGAGVAGNKLAMSQSQPQQFQNQNQNVVRQQPALPPLLHNNNYNNSFNVAPTLNVVKSAANNFPPLNVVNSSAAIISPPLNVVNSVAADNSPPLNVVSSTNNFINSSTTFSEFLQNLGGCNFSMLTDNLTSNDGHLQDMIK